MPEHPKGSLIATVRLIPETDDERDMLGLCRGGGKPPIPRPPVDGKHECGGCGGRLELDDLGLVLQHDARRG